MELFYYGRHETPIEELGIIPEAEAFVSQRSC